MAVTIRDLAEHLNLSKSTVSYALNGGPKPVSEDVRRRVEEAALAMGFRRNEIARSLAVGRTHTIGFVTASVRQRTLRSWFELTALEAVCVSADELGLHLLLPSLKSPCGDRGISDPRFASRVDGVILLAPSKASVLSEYFASRGIPFATVAGDPDGLGPTFNADNVAAAESLADYLYSLGHRKVGIVTNFEHQDVQQRYQGFMARSKALGLVIAPEFIETTDLHMAGGYEAGKRMLARNERPTAVFCVNDPTALGFISAARELGISVPQELSVVGFDNDQIGETYSPSITTFRQPVSEMAHAALESVLDQIAGKPTASRIFSTELIVRASTSPLEDISSHA